MSERCVRGLDIRDRTQGSNWNCRKYGVSWIITGMFEICMEMKYGEKSNLED